MPFIHQSSWTAASGHLLTDEETIERKISVVGSEMLLFSDVLTNSDKSSMEMRNKRSDRRLLDIVYNLAKALNKLETKLYKRVGHRLAESPPTPAPEWPPGVEIR
jgi:hypothetical protein